ncbi:DUF1311 domain-containing protein [Candidatus Marithioploca araucensis]|uniref:DUF1311 domain-containing protein n=1 Tax=Candidatus Marithioploca araucensis TaxID=70273 RepID=A0ABT7VSW1_9GAMM|nr:DUF1311 domain-containing protein [Candidatus Marithioploca araucensis]
MLIRSKKSLCLIAGLSLVSSFIHAEEKHPIDIKTEACMEKDYSTLGMMNCSAQSEKLWDTELNRVYRGLQSQLNEKAKKQLKNAQLQWLKYRNAEFKAIDEIYSVLYEKSGGGTMWRLLPINAKVEIIKERVLVLTGYLTNFKPEVQESGE